MINSFHPFGAKWVLFFYAGGFTPCYMLTALRACQNSARSGAAPRSRACASNFSAVPGKSLGNKSGVGSVPLFIASMSLALSSGVRLIFGICYLVLFYAMIYRLPSYEMTNQYPFRGEPMRLMIPLSLSFFKLFSTAVVLTSIVRAIAGIDIEESLFIRVNI